MKKIGSIILFLITLSTSSFAEYYISYTAPEDYPVYDYKGTFNYRPHYKGDNLQSETECKDDVFAVSRTSCFSSPVDYKEASFKPTYGRKEGYTALDADKEDLPTNDRATWDDLGREMQVTE